MAGIMDVIGDMNIDSSIYNLIKPEGPFAGPLSITPKEAEQPSIEDSLQKLYKSAEEKAFKEAVSGVDGDLDNFLDDFPSFYEIVNQYKTSRRKDLSPDYIYKEGLLGRPKYNKTPQGLFTDSYDPDSSKTLNMKQIEREYGDFRNILLKSRDTGGDYNLDDLFYNEVFSPTGQSVMEMIKQYQNKYNDSEYLPETFEQLIKMSAPQLSA